MGSSEVTDPACKLIISASSTTAKLVDKDRPPNRDSLALHSGSPPMPLSSAPPPHLVVLGKDAVDLGGHVVPPLRPSDRVLIYILLRASGQALRTSLIATHNLLQGLHAAQRKQGRGVGEGFVSPLPLEKRQQ